MHHIICRRAADQLTKSKYGSAPMAECLTLQYSRSLSLGLNGIYFPNLRKIIPKRPSKRAESGGFVIRLVFGIDEFDDEARERGVLAVQRSLVAGVERASLDPADTEIGGIMSS
ncbi:hypothetical protein E9232_005762 [Inquilinus ginsengisoli]|uniref:Uncharacterized protein n=1 Tax=Inquilinus ginsengisoli TaxID=363840 RepID=A0ABU1JX64_9PROT|nr:hypothetical protein [Inquilinus ginsengisoli]